MNFDAGIGPYYNNVYLRMSEWEEFQRDLSAYRAAEQAQDEHTRGGAPISQADELVLKVCGCRVMFCFAHSRTPF